MTSRIRRLLAVTGIATCLCGMSAPLWAQSDWPSKPIKLLVSSAAGGGADTVARLVAQHVSNELKQPVVVENRAGGSGVLAANALLAAPADGYTFLLGFTTMAQLPATAGAALPFKVERDFTPVSLVAKSSNILVASKATGVNSVSELLAAVKASPAKFSYGSYGNGSTGHFLAAQFAITANVDIPHVPYRGAAPMMTDLLGGVLSFGFPDIGSALPHIGSDRIRVLAVTGDKRLASLPQVPTMSELGMQGFNLGAWFGVFASAGTPAPIVSSMSARVAAAVKDPEVRAKLVGMNLEPVGSTAPAFAEFFKADLRGWADVAKKAQIKAE